MKNYFSVLFVLLINFSAIAQQSDSSLLQHFKYRIDNYRAINFYVGGGGNFVKNSDQTPYLQNSNVNGGANAGVFMLKSTEKILQTSDLNFSTNFSLSDAKNLPDKNRNNSFSGSISGSINNKFYSGKNFFLAEGGISAFVNSGRTSLTSYPVRTKNTISDLYLNIGAGLGSGRLENVTDMQNALWLNKALKEDHILKGQLSEDELIGLGKAITSANNTRVLDSRRKTRFILETVDKYLQGKGLISKTDIKYFSALNDVIFYAINSQRMSGVEKYIKLVPVFSYRRDFDRQAEPVYENETKTTAKAISLIASWKKYKPVSLFHQRNFGVALQLMRGEKDLLYTQSGNGTPSETKSYDDNSKVAISAFFQHLYFPNTRTTISFTFDTEGGYQIYSGNSQWFNMTNVGCSLNYFISNNTRLTGGIGATFQKNYADITRINQYYQNILRLDANLGIAINL